MYMYVRMGRILVMFRLYARNCESSQYSWVALDDSAIAVSPASMIVGSARSYL